VADLIFGLMPKPTGTLKERIEAGEVLLGGCCLPVMGEDPIWQCADCGTEYVRAIGPGDPEFDILEETKTVASDDREPEA